VLDIKCAVLAPTTTGSQHTQERVDRRNSDLYLETKEIPAATHYMAG
jgi:hypothetical protein